MTALIAVLERSRDLGFLGPGPVNEHVAHAERYRTAISRYRTERVRAGDGGTARGSGGRSVDAAAADSGGGGAVGGEVAGRDGGSAVGLVRAVDLGAGGGVPALPLLVADPDLDLTLVDASARRMSFCAWALTELNVADRARVWIGRAEEFGHDPAHREQYEVVVGRGFGPPASTVECAAPLLVAGGWCVVSEPPGGRPWPSEIPELGLTTVEGGDGVAVLSRTGTVLSDYPRSAKRQKRLPLFNL